MGGLKNLTPSAPLQNPSLLNWLQLEPVKPENSTPATKVSLALFFFFFNIIVMEVTGKLFYYKNI